MEEPRPEMNRGDQEALNSLVYHHGQLVGKVDYLGQQLGEHQQYFEQVRARTDQLHLESEIGASEVQRQGQLLTEHHEALLQIRQESMTNDQGLNEQIANLRTRVEQLTGEMGILREQRNTPMVEENGERLQRVWGRIGEQDLLSQNLVKEITGLHQKIGVMETVHGGLSLRNEEIAEGLEQTWEKTEELTTELEQLKEEMEAMKQRPTRNDTGENTQKIAQIESNVGAIGQNQRSMHEQLGLINQEIQRLDTEMARQRGQATLLRTKTGETFTELRQGLTGLRATTRADMEALDSHSHGQVTQLYATLQKEVQNELHSRDRRIKDLEDAMRKIIITQNGRGTQMGTASEQAREPSNDRARGLERPEKNMAGPPQRTTAARSPSPPGSEAPPCPSLSPSGNRESPPWVL